MLTFEQKETMAGLLILFTFVAIFGIISKLFRNELVGIILEKDNYMLERTSTVGC